VSYSKLTILLWRMSFSFLTGLVCSGNLPPETRKEQARLFEDPTSGYDILVASDAIGKLYELCYLTDWRYQFNIVGMGLNLSIKRIVFTSVEKYDGVERRLLSSSVSCIICV
jgi:ATP-dependent RNA helicase SUPV3L1/SUV3